MSDQPAILLFLSYFIGSVPFGLLAGKLKGVDIRNEGSGNIGTTNVFRICGKGLGFAVFVLDVIKGLIPVLLGKHFFDGSDGIIPILCGVAAILGHNFPIWLKFKGGKGIATSAGVLGGLLPWALLFAFTTWVLSFALTRYVSVASILAAVSLPITVGIQIFLLGGTRPIAYFIFAVAIGLLAVWRHRANIARLRAGTEHRFLKRSKA